MLRTYLTTIDSGTLAICVLSSIQDSIISHGVALEVTLDGRAFGVDKDRLEPHISSVLPHPVGVDYSEVREFPGHSILSNILQALRSSELGDTHRSLSPSRNRAMFPCTSPSDSHSDNDKTLFCPISEVSRSIKPGWPIKPKDGRIPSPLYCCVSHGCLQIGSGWFSPSLGHILVCAHFSFTGMTIIYV